MVGWLLPFLLSLNLTPPAASFEKPPFFKAPFRAPAVPWVILLLLAALSVRFWKVSSLMDFPLSDEIINGFYSVHLAEDWNWHPFFHLSQLPPLYIWGLALVVKFFGLTKNSIWVLPAALSFFSVVLLYCASLTYFSKSLSFIFLVLLAVTFWPVFIGHFSHQAVSLVFLESLVLLLLAGSMKNQGQHRGYFHPFLLGLCLGLGFTTYFAWPLVAVLILGTLLGGLWGNPKFNLKHLAVFIFGATLFPAPLILSAFKEGYGGYLHGLFLANINPDNLTPWSLDKSLSYFTQFFWQGWRENFAYNPRWGGFLNPFLGGFFFLGLGELWRYRRHATARWLGIALGVLFFPILLANNTNWFHVAPLMPFFLLITALGIQVFSGTFKKLNPLWVLVPLASASVTLDSLNFQKTMAFINQTENFPAISNAFKILEEKNKAEGPGMIFTRFNSDPLQLRLDTMTHGFNLLRNPHTTPAPNRWAAIFASDRDKSSLTKRFSEVLWIQTLPTNPPSPDEVWLAIIPFNSFPKADLSKWSAADRILENSVFDYFNRPQTRSKGDIEEKLLNSGFYFKNDPFLESSYWEMLSLCYLADKDYPQALRAKREAFRCRQNQTARDDYQLGGLFLKNQRFREAANYFKTAGSLNPEYEPPISTLEFLKKMSQDHPSAKF